MRIRTQLLASAALAGLVALSVLLGLAEVTRRDRDALARQAQAQDIGRSVAQLLTAADALAVRGAGADDPRWQADQAALLSKVDEAILHAGGATPALNALRGQVMQLEPLLRALTEIAPTAADALQRERRAQVLERLFELAPRMLETCYLWSHDIVEAQREAHRIHTAIVLGAPALLLALGVSLGLLVGRRVLRPLEQLRQAVAAIRAGDADARCASDADDELGDVARAVDEMARALKAEAEARRLSEQRLRLITDHLPALVSHVDNDERYTFVNAHFGRLASGDPASMIGRSLREVRGDEVYRMLAPHVHRALAGETVSFETTRVEQGRTVHRQSTYVPDIDPHGRVNGFYAMTFDVTDRKEAELRLAAGERLLVDVTDNVPALVAYLDIDQHYRFANSKYREWLDADPKAMVGRHVRDAVGEDFHALVAPHIEAALRGERVRWERQSTVAGRSRWLLAEYIPDIGADGRVRGCYAFTIDITERRRAELAVSRSEQRLQDLMNSIPAMVGYFDMQERCQYANESGLKAQGFEHADLPGLTLRDTLGESNYAQHAPYVKEVLRGHRARLEGKIPFGEREAHFEAHLIPDRVQGGLQRGFYVMTFDVTALKEAQQRQARVERQLRAITDNLPALIAYVDRDERYRFANATFRRWLDVDPAAVIGQPVREILSPALYRQRLDGLRQALAGRRVEFEIESETLGVTRSLKNVYIPDIQSDGSVAGFYALSTDVSALKAVEQELSRLARVDALTGLPNRRQFDERLAETAARSARSGQPLALMFLDVDHFKSVNDTLGHAAGDAVLKEFGRRLKAALRITDLAARLAGDEFVVLLEGVRAGHEAECVAEKIVAAMRRPFRAGDAALRVSTSVGIAYCPHPDAAGATAAALLETADAALYEAKSAGRDTWRLKAMAAPEPPARLRASAA